MEITPFVKKIVKKSRYHYNRLSCYDLKIAAVVNRPTFAILKMLIIFYRYNFFTNNAMARCFVMLYIDIRLL